VAADLRPVVLARAARPLIESELVESELGRLDTDLPVHELDRLAWKIAAAARKPAGPDGELQQQREPEVGRPALARDHVPLVVQQRPVPDQLIEIQRSRHGRR
jgi:hypothetical protein